MSKINMSANRSLSPNYPVRGTAKARNIDTDPLNQFTNPTLAAVGGLTLGGKDYEPTIPMCGFEVHGTQSQTIVMVEFENGSIGRFDNITIAADAGWLAAPGYSILKILKESTATGIYPLFN